MADHAARVFLSELDPGHPDFPIQGLSWASQAQNEIAELIAGTKKMLAESHELLAEIDRILARG